MAWTQDFYNTFEGGTDGATFDPAASGGTSGTAFTRATATDMGTNVAAPNTNTVQWTTAWSFSGGKGLRMVQPGTAKAAIYAALPQARTDFAIGFGTHWLTAPLVTGPICRLFTDTAFTSPGCFDIGLSTANKVYLRDNIAGVQTANSAGVLTANFTPGFWWSFRYQAALNSATLNVYIKGQTAVKATWTINVPTATQVQGFWIGIGTASTGMTHDWDDVITGTGAEAPRPDLVNAAPTVTATGASKRAVQVGSTVSDLTYTATDTDGLISTLAASVTARPAGSVLPAVSGTPTGIGTASAALTASAPFAAVGTYEVTATAVDNGSPGQSGSAKYTVDTFPQQGDTTWIRSVDPGTDTQLGTQSDLPTAMIDGDATTGLITQPSPVNATRWIQTGALPTTGISVRVSGYRSGSGTLTRHIELYKADKTTLLWQTSPDLVFGSVNETQTLQVPSGPLGSIPAATDRTGLWWKIVDTIS